MTPESDKRRILSLSEFALSISCLDHIFRLIEHAMMWSVGDLWVTILPSTRIKNDVDLLRLTFLDRFEAGIPVVAEVQGFCTLIQGSHLFIPLGEAALPDHLARIFSRDSAISAPNPDHHAHDADVRTAEGEDVTLDGEKGPIIRGAIAGDNAQGTH